MAVEIRPVSSRRELRLDHARDRTASSSNTNTRSSSPTTPTAYPQVRVRRPTSDYIAAWRLCYALAAVTMWTGCQPRPSLRTFPSSASPDRTR